MNKVGRAPCNIANHKPSENMKPVSKLHDQLLNQKKKLQIGINNVLSLLVKLFGSDTASSEQEVFCLEMKAKHAYWTAGLERKS